MKKLFFAILMLTTTFIPAAYAQTNNNTAQLNSANSGIYYTYQTSEPSIQSVVKQKTPDGSLSVFGEYKFTELQSGPKVSEWGWSVVPEINLNPYLGVQADFSSEYTHPIYPSRSTFSIAAGPRVNLMPHSKIMPYVYAEGGEVRVERQNVRYSDWNPMVATGIGVEYRVTPNFALTWIPAQYTGQNMDNNGWNHSFSTKFGLTWNIN